MKYDYLCGYFLADGYCSHTGREVKSVVHAETKDEDFANKLVQEFGGRVKSRIREVRTGARCNFYMITFSTDVSVYIRNAMTSYKDFWNYFIALSDQDQDDFIQGLFDGDGSICKYSGSEKSRVVLYAADDITRKIINKWLVERGIKASVSVDRRGHNVTQYSIGHRGSLIKILIRFRFRFLNRKYDLLQEIFKNYTWIQCDGGGITCDRSRIQKETGMSQSLISLALKGRKFKGHELRIISTEEIDKSKVWI